MSLSLSCAGVQARSTAMKHVCQRVLACGALLLALCGAAQAEANQVRFALPAPKVSVQAIMLEMIAEITLGKFDALDHLTVGMSHPDGTAAMLSGKLEISSHFTSAPFQYQQLENPAIRKLLSSYDATDGPNTFSVVATIARWRDANPQLYKVVQAAILEANDF